MKEVEPYIFIHRIKKNHINKLIKLVHKSGGSYLKQDACRVSKSDWNSPKDMKRPYWIYFKKYCLNDFTVDLLTTLKSHRLHIHNYWYQIYEQGDYHGSHTHPDGNFSHVLYLKSENLTLIKKSKYKMKNPEGIILTFPGFLQHCSPPAKQQKIIISFNSSIGIENRNLNNLEVSLPADDY
tara:strand:+ start:676 stop:1218 length:543 start_codon:yes stop_codon:yes gene_type:complete